MRIFVINLARAVARLEKMAAQLSALGLSFERLEAVDGRQLAPKDRAFVDEEARKRITIYPLSDNEIGCWLSHRRALQAVATGADDMAVVLEDDARLTPDFARVLIAIQQQKPDFDFIFLHRKFKKCERFVPTLNLLPDLRLGRVGPAHMGAIGYIVSRRGARAFLDYAPRFAHAVDKEIHRYWANGLDIYGLERPIVMHDDEGRSFIEETRDQDKPAVRLRYPDADCLYYRWQRALTRLSDSLQKRHAWSRLQKKRKAG